MTASIENLTQHLVSRTHEHDESAEVCPPRADTGTNGASLCSAVSTAKATDIIRLNRRTYRAGRKAGASLSYEAISGSISLASMMKRRTWRYPDIVELDFTAITEPADITRWTSRDEESVGGFLVNRGFVVHRGVRVWCPPVCAAGMSPRPWIPDLIVGKSLIVEVDSPASLGGGPSHHDGFPAYDMHRLDMFRAVGFRTLAVRLNGLEPLDGHRCVTSDSGLTVAVYRDVLEAVTDLVGETLRD